MPVKGIERVKHNLKVTLGRISEQRTDEAVRAILTQGAAYAAVRTPRDTATLLNSQYKPVITQTRGKTSGQVGYGASYAAAVHDAAGKYVGQNKPRGAGSRGNYWDPSGEPQYLAKGFEEVIPQVPAILKGVYGV